MKKIIGMVLKAVTVGVGIAVLVLSIIGDMDAHTGITLLGLGLACVGILQIRK